MNVTGAYNQFGIFGGQETQRTSAVAGKVQPKVQPLFTSGGDTVSISLEALNAQALAKGLPPFDAKLKEMQAGLEDGSVKLKMFNDPTFNPEYDVMFLPEAIVTVVAFPGDRDMRVMTQEEHKREQGRLNFTPLPAYNPTVIKQGYNLEGDKYFEAMRQFGIDPFDSDALLQFSKDTEKMKAVEELFLGILGESS